MRTFMLLVTAAMLILLPTVHSAGVETFSDPDARRVATELINSTACPEQLVSSLNQLLLPSPDKFGLLCGASYFAGCKDEFMKRCALTDCASTSEKRSFYEKWVDAYSLTGRSYTCTTIGYNKTIAVLGQQGQGYICIASNGLKLLNPINEIIQLMWTGKSFSCSDMSSAMDRVLVPLNNCTNPTLRNLISGYLNTVAAQSPCKIAVGEGAAIRLNSGIVMLTLFATMLFGYFNL